MAEPIKLKCQFCALQSECQRKERKEKYDESMTTYCTMGVNVRQPKRRQHERRR
jgi:hypothetical protein